MNMVLQIFVPAGNSFGPPLFDVESVKGGSAWGAGTFAGAMGGRQPTQLELDVAEHQVTIFISISPPMLFVQLISVSTCPDSCSGLALFSCTASQNNICADSRLYLPKYWYLSCSWHVGLSLQQHNVSESLQDIRGAQICVQQWSCSNCSCACSRRIHHDQKYGPPDVRSWRMR